MGEAGDGTVSTSRIVEILLSPHDEGSERETKIFSRIDSLNKPPSADAKWSTEGRVITSVITAVDRKTLARPFLHRPRVARERNGHVGSNKC
jgi:hypothetical protein